MILGLSLSNFTTLHVVISLIGIVSGLVVLYGMLINNRLDGWTAVFLLSTVLTSVTGFLFPFTQILPSHIFGILSLAVLAPAILARYPFKLVGAWRWIYVTTSLFALYLNCFVLVVQIVLKVPGVKALVAPQGEPPFLIAQVPVLIAFIVLGFLAVRKFRPLPV
jgi:hypothetical protein